MGLKRGVEIILLASVKGGMAEFYTPESSRETMLVNVPAGTIDDLFVHHFSNRSTALGVRKFRSSCFTKS